MLDYLLYPLLVLTIKTAFDVGQRLTHDKPFRVGVTSLVLVPFVAIPTLLQLAIPRLYHGLAGIPSLTLQHHEYWRLLTAVTVQDGGLVGAMFNLVALVFITLVADRVWGWRKAIAIFVVAAVALNLVGVLFGAEVAGNSGATFVLATSMVGAYLIARRPKGKLWEALACAAIGIFLSAFQNPHGYAIVAGVIAGGLLRWLPTALATAHRSDVKRV
jgi:membrane associated rhomboid family serine protease